MAVPSAYYRYSTSVGLISQDPFSLDGVSRMPKSPSCAYVWPIDTPEDKQVESWPDDELPKGLDKGEVGSDALEKIKKERKGCWLACFPRYGCSLLVEGIRIE